MVRPSLPAPLGPFSLSTLGAEGRGAVGPVGGLSPLPPPAWERGCESHEHPGFSDLYGTEGKSDTNQTPAPSWSPEPQYA